MSNTQLRRSARLAAMNSTVTASINNNPLPDTTPFKEHTPNPATVSTSTDTQSFTYFSKLPPELRNNIWGEACMVERIVDLWIADPFTKYDDEQWCMNYPKTWEWRWITYGSHNRIPAILNASRESRAIGLKHYSPLLGTEITDLSGNTKTSKTGKEQSKTSLAGGNSLTKEQESTKGSQYLGPAVIYINWECDIICPYEIPTEHIPRFQIEFKLSNRFKSMKKLALPLGRLGQMVGTSDIGYTMPKNLDLKEVILYPDCKRHFPRDFQVFSLQKSHKFSFSDFDTASDDTVSLYDYDHFNADVVRKSACFEKWLMEYSIQGSHCTGNVQIKLISTVDLKSADQ